jgi:NADH-quinone oxidoreductase subunit H
MKEMVLAQRDQGVWFVFYQPVAFIIYYIAALAETNRAPFDMPEAESEIVAGYHTEYSGFRWSLYFLAEYANMVIVCSIATSLFLGGWLRPFPNVAALNFLDYTPVGVFVGLGAFCLLGAAREQRERALEKLGMAGFGGLLILTGLAFALPPVLEAAGGVFWFVLKVVLGLYTFIWIRFTLPRYRYDQLMRVGWRWLIPLAIANVIVTGIIMQLTAE